MNSLIIGAGEVGTALYNILRKHYSTLLGNRDVGVEPSFDCVEVIHICFPYSKDFISDVKDYIEIFRPKYTVIHSTVPVGTSRQCQAFHSPVRGMHPDLERHLKSFPKYLAPPDKNLKMYFEKAGISIRLVKNPETTEFLKIWDTTQYGTNIMLEKWAFQFCQENKLDFKTAYTDANQTYNETYSRLGLKNVVRPVLEHQKGPVGGHCIIPNCRLLKSPFTNLILKLNKKCVY